MEQVIVEPWEQRLWRFVTTWWQQIAITQAGIYLVASFGQGHDILPWWVAWGLALGMEGTYLRGLVDASHVRGSGRGWATALIAGTYVTIILWGIAHILSLSAVGVIPDENLGAGWGGFIAAIHVLPVAFTGLCSAMLHRARSGEELDRTDAQRRAIEQYQQRRQQQLDEEAAVEREARRQQQLEQERKRHELELWQQAQQFKASLKAASQTSQSSVTASRDTTAPSGDATRSAAARSDRDVFKAAVIAAFRDDPSFNRAALAERHGWSRPAVVKILKEEGLL